MYKFSGGIPRLINILGDNALLTAYAMGKKQIDQWIIEEVAHDLSLRKLEEPSNGRAVTDKACPNGAVPALGNGAFPLRSAREHRTVDAVVNVVSVQRLNGLRSGLIDAMGPMAPIVLDERIRMLGYTMSTLPEKKWETLVDSVSDEILDSLVRRRFRESYR